MARLGWTICIAVAVSVMVIADPSTAQFTRGRKAILARIEGYIAEKPQQTLPLTSWVLRDRKTLRRFQVVEIRVLEGDVSYDNIVTAMEPYSYDDALATFFLRGPAILLDQFAATPNNQRIVIIGYLRLPQRQWNLSSIEVVPTPTP